jgi:hypothetical protein
MNVPAKALSNDPDGEIFITKLPGDIVNCGPVAALMLAKYINADFGQDSLITSINKARKIVMDDKSQELEYSWWKMRHIKKYLQRMSVKYDRAILRDDQPLKERQEEIITKLNEGNVVLINIDMNDLSFGFEVGKPYVTFALPGIAWGHYLVIVGYEEVKGKMVFKIHDSFSKYGKSRRYYVDNILNSIHSYNPEVLYVKNTKVSMGNLWASASK